MFYLTLQYLKFSFFKSGSDKTFHMIQTVCKAAVAFCQGKQGSSICPVKSNTHTHAHTIAHTHAHTPFSELIKKSHDV